jgi:hypothetical protein
MCGSDWRKFFRTAGESYFAACGSVLWAGLVVGKVVLVVSGICCL